MFDAFSNCVEKFTFDTRPRSHMLNLYHFSGKVGESKTWRRSSTDHLFRDVLPYGRQGSDPVQESYNELLKGVQILMLFDARFIIHAAVSW